MKDKPSITKLPFDNQGFPKPWVGLKKATTCNHKYQVLNSNTETIYADGGAHVVKISAVFFCEKCLNIQHKNESITHDTNEPTSTL